jgi:adenosylmethionine-8-amino-7-oxononanoate aminotransferase
VVRFPSPYLFSKNGQSEKLIEMMEERLHGHEQEFIGVVMEPLIQGAAGMLTHSKGFLKKVRSFCDRHHLLMIVDEVATGFGRSGKMFACDHEKVTPDLMAIAKGITGGYLPLAATLVKEKIYNAFLGQYSEFKTFFHGHTYTGNPLACAVALASLRLFKKERIFQSLSPKIRWFKRELNKFLNLRHVAEIRQCGMMVGIELVKTRSPRKEYALVEKIGIRVCQKVREYGVILRSLGNVIVIMPPLSIHQKELRVILNATYRAIEEVTGKGFRD